MCLVLRRRNVNFTSGLHSLYILLLRYSSPIALVAAAVKPIESPDPSFIGVATFGLTTLFRRIYKGFSFGGCSRGVRTELGVSGAVGIMTCRGLRVQFPIFLYVLDYG